MGILSNKSFVDEIDIKQLTAPAVQPVTLDEQKLYSRIDGDFEDTLIDTLIVAATKQAEAFVGGGFITRTWRQSEDGKNENFFDNGFPFGLIRLSGISFAFEIKNVQISSVESLTFYDINNNPTVISPTLFRLDRPNSDQPSRIVFNIGSSIGINTRTFTQYELEYTAGYADASKVPGDIKLAIMASAQAWYENRETIGGVPKSAKSLLMSYRVLEL